MRSPVPAAPTPLRPGAFRDFARLAAEAMVVGVFASAALLLAALFISAAEAAPLGAPSTGTLLFKGGDVPIPAPLVATDVRIEVAGVIGRTRVSQRFVNPGDDWREGVYLFPLPEGAAVDRLEMRIGERRIEGQIRERGQARRDYDAAKAQGRKAALVEQERPNLFTTSVAPIGPGDEVVVTIEYQQTLRQEAGRFSLRFPMAITPRYGPKATPETAQGDAGSTSGGDRVPDTSRISQPVVHPASGKVIPVTLIAIIDAGFPLVELKSRHHAISVDETLDGRYTIVLDGPVPADRDFELEFAPALGRAPGATVFGEAWQGRSYALVMLVPSLPDAGAPRTAREVTYIIDTSGSMAGSSIVQAKSALMFALDRLQPRDRFNVIEFNSHSRALFATPMPVDPATLGRARSFVTGLKANGGTEMREALALALQPAGSDPSLVRQVVFLTDGAVGNEDELFALILERLGDRRLFTIGIGSAPNSHFMAKAAQFGRGTFTMIGDVRDVQEKMAALIRKLESPVLTDIVLEWPAAVDAWPRTVPDLYAGEPIVVAAALDRLDGDVVVRGRHGGTPWQATLPLAVGGAANGVHALWARAKIDALSDARIAGADADDVRAAIVRIALEHQLVSRHTSLVAVDVERTAPFGIDAKRTVIPGNLPQGQEYEAIFGGLPQTATPATRDMLIAAMFLIAALLFGGFTRAGSTAGAWRGGR